MTGTSHEYEPEIDSIAYVDFEEAPEDADRRNWMVDAACDVLGEVGDLIRPDLLFLELDLRGEELFWQWVERRVNEAGYDTYNSDTRFEVFPSHVGLHLEDRDLDELQGISDDWALGTDELEAVNDELES